MLTSELAKKGNVYTAIIQQMYNYQYAYLGGYIFKQQVRKKRPSEDSVLWNDLITNTVAQPLCRYVVDTINDILFEPGIMRDLRFANPNGELVNTDNAEWVNLFVMDCDLNNRSLTSFMEQVGDLTSIFGHCWIAVDMPQTSEGNLGRPYTCAISPVDVWDWEWQYYGGRPILKYVKIKEMEDEEYYYIKCYHLGDSENPSSWASYRLPKMALTNVINTDADCLGSGTFPPGMAIPVFIAYGRRDPRIIDLGVSDIDAASDAMRELYKLECEAYTALQFAHTIIRAEKGIAIPVHAGAIVRALKDQVEAIKIDTGDVEQIIKKQSDILTTLEGLVGMGGMRKDSQQIASGISIIEERKQLHRVAKSKARLMEVTEGLIFTFAARFMGMRWAGVVNYNTDYEAYDTNYRLALLQQAQIMAGDSEIVKALITKELIGLLAPAENTKTYEDAFIESMPDSNVKDLLTEEASNALSSDNLDSMVPVLSKDYVEPELNEPNDKISGDQPQGLNKAQESDVGNFGDPNNMTLLGGPGTPMTPMGTSYYPQQAVAVQITGLNTGR